MARTKLQLSDMKKVVDSLINNPTKPGRHVKSICAGVVVYEHMTSRRGLLTRYGNVLYWGSIPVSCVEILEPSDVAVHHMNGELTVLTHDS